MKVYKVIAPGWNDDEKKIIMSTRGVFTSYMNASLFMEAYRSYFNSENVKIVEEENDSIHSIL